jgi:hypothetical protein
MSEHGHDDEEKDWFEPVGAGGGHLMGKLGWSAGAVPISKRVPLLVGLMVVTLVVGVSSGAFDERAVTNSIALDAGPKPMKAVSLDDAMAGHMVLPKDLGQGSKEGPQAGGEGKTTEVKAAKKPAKKLDLAKVWASGMEALSEKRWERAVELLEDASVAWKAKKSGSEWRNMRYGLAKAHYKNKNPGRSVAVLEELLLSDLDWGKPIFLLGLAAKANKDHARGVKYLKQYIEEGGSKTVKVCPYLDKRGALANATKTVRKACR